MASSFLGLVALSGCSPLFGDLDFSPVARNLENLPSGTSETDAFGPFIERERRPDRTRLAVRPLFVTEDRPYHDGPQREKVVSFLPPFGKYHRNPRTKQWRFWPLLWYVKERTGEGGVDTDFLLFPILMFGSSTPPPHALAAGEKPETYFAIFPLGGEVHSFAGFDRWQFLAWPLFQRMTKRVYDEEENFTSIGLLFGWVTGAPRGGSWHVLPFYLRSKWVYPPYRAPKYPEGADPSRPLPRYDKRSFFWPFFHYQILDQDRGPGKETRLIAFWPFFKHEKGIDHEFWTFLWPFFRWNREYPEERESYRAKEGLEEDGAKGEEEPNVLVDFLSQVVWRYEKTKDYRRRRLLLFLYDDYESLPKDVRKRRSHDRIESMSILHPVGYWKRRVEKLGPDGGYRDDSTFVLVPFFQAHRRTWLDPEGAETGRVDRFWKLWPLVSYEWDGDGRRDVHLLSLLPLRLEKYTRDFDEGWGPFFEFYRYRRDADVHGGTVHHDALFRLLKIRSNDQDFSISIPLLLSWRDQTTAQGVHRWRRSFLAGLFGWEGERSETGERRVLRLFGWPVEIGNTSGG